MNRLTDGHIAQIRQQSSGFTDALAREVQQWRALIPEVIEQLEAVCHQYGGQPSYIHPAQLDAIIAKLREVLS